MCNHRDNNTPISIILFFSALILTSTAFAYEKFSNPVIFIHGIASGADAWKDFGKLLKQNQLTVGGCITLDRDSGELQSIFVRDVCDSTNPAVSQGDFYLMQFSDNHNLTFFEQAKELAVVIDAVSNVNGRAKVILVAHSMGGLAARSYLQLFTQLTDSEHNVIRLITVGTPHSGANIVGLCQNSYICNIKGISPSSLAIADLDPDSVALQVLNDLIHHPLPSEVSYTSIIGIGGLYILGDGDGIVSASSQDLGKVIEENGALNLHHTSKAISVRNCHIFSIPEVHTCETSDSQILTEVLNQIYQCDKINSGDTVPEPYGAAYNVLSPEKELLLKAFCTQDTTDIIIGSPHAAAETGDLTQNYQGLTYVWSTAYRHDPQSTTGNKWIAVPLACAGEDSTPVSGWCKGKATGELPTSTQWFVGYTCEWNGSKWMCACTDSSCSRSFWQIQGIQR